MKKHHIEERKPALVPPKVKEFEVEATLDSKMVRGRLFYLTKWVGYPGEDTWEPAEHYNFAPVLPSSPPELPIVGECEVDCQVKFWNSFILPSLQNQFFQGWLQRNNPGGTVRRGMSCIFPPAVHQLYLSGHADKVHKGAHTTNYEFSHARNVPEIFYGTDRDRPWWRRERQGTDLLCDDGTYCDRFIVQRVKGKKGCSSCRPCITSLCGVVQLYYCTVV